MSVTKYVAGFLFDPARTHVALVRKNRPDWMAGKLNAIGGHVEPTENYAEAMRREFLEETGVDIPNWEYFTDLGGGNMRDGFRVRFYRAFSEDVYHVSSCTDEAIGIVPLSHIPFNDGLMNNLTWLLFMALSMDNERAKAFNVQEM